MDVLDGVLEDWRACRPDGAVLRAQHLDMVLERMAERVGNSQAPRAVQRQTFEAIRPPPDSSARPLLVRQLAVDGHYSHCSGEGVVHFIRFWQVIEALELQLAAPAESEREPLFSEASTFRERLLARVEEQALTGQQFLAELRAARKLSADVGAWEALEQVADLALRLPPQQPVEASECSPLPLDTVSTLLLPWLQELTEDYCRGERAGKLRAVRDVLRCTKREAAEHLGAAGWDIEAALRRFYVGGPVLAALEACSASGPWSSQNAKLRSSELQCPICMTEYRPGSESTVTKCCFQVLCVHCVEVLADDTQLRCPFCRCLSQRPIAKPELTPAEWADSVSDAITRAASRCAEHVIRVAADLVAAMQPADHLPQHDLRLDVVLNVTR